MLPATCCNTIMFRCPVSIDLPQSRYLFDATDPKLQRLDCGWGLSQDVAGVGKTVIQRRRVYRVPGGIVLAWRLELSVLRGNRRIDRPAQPLALRSMPIRDIDHCWNCVSGSRLPIAAPPDGANEKVPRVSIFDGKERGYKEHGESFRVVVKNPVQTGGAVKVWREAVSGVVRAVVGRADWP
jgi:hypothetical protein